MLERIIRIYEQPLNAQLLRFLVSLHLICPSLVCVFSLCLVAAKVVSGV
jgi:hypothetical protein